MRRLIVVYASCDVDEQAPNENFAAHPSDYTTQAVEVRKRKAVKGREKSHISTGCVYHNSELKRCLSQMLSLLAALWFLFAID